MSLEWDWGIWRKWWKKKLKALKIMGIFKNQSNRTIQKLIRLNCIWRINGRACQYNPITFVCKSTDDFRTIIFYWAFYDTLDGNVQCAMRNEFAKWFWTQDIFMNHFSLQLLHCNVWIIPKKYITQLWKRSISIFQIFMIFCDLLSNYIDCIIINVINT